MPYPIKSLEKVRSDILADWRNEDDEVTVDADSDNYVRATGIASAIVGLYQYVKWGINQWFPDTAEIANLVRFASARGITQEGASSSVGTVQFPGTIGAPLVAGTVFQVGNGNQYQTSVAGEVTDDGFVTVTASALVPGVIGNLADNTAATLQTAPFGIDAAGVVLQMRGGVEAELDADFLDRILEYLRHPPAGGNKDDFVRWALEVPGITQAWSYPKRRGPGTTDVGVLSNGLPPSDALLSLVYDHIDGLRPTYGDTMILLIQQIGVNISGTLSLDDSVTLDMVTPKIQAALAEYFATIKPGDTVYRQRIVTIILSVAGVLDLILTAPAVNVTTLVDASHIEQSTLGAIALAV